MDRLGTEHRAVPCAPGGDVLRCIRFSGFQTLWAHRLQVYAPALAAVENVNHLPRHVERGQDDPGEHQEIRRLRFRPMRGGMQNFLFRPGAREKQGHAAERHHADGVSDKSNRH